MKNPKVKSKKVDAVTVVDNLIYMKNETFAKRIETLTDEQLKIITKQLKSELKLRNIIK